MNMPKLLKYLLCFTLNVVLAALVDSHVQNIYSNILNNIDQLPFCGDEISRIVNQRLLYVTTLDGKINALDLSQNGKMHWQIPTGPGPLISSSIHRLELTNNGKFVRMIPSLNGGIYKFDGKTIDLLPISAENLLSSSFKFSDDIVISGGKETRSYGVSVRTGQILYECSMNGCLNKTALNSYTPHDTPSLKEKYVNEDHDNLLDDVVLIRRQTQTVRAVETRTGNERWNFSVGQHEIELLKSPECQYKQNYKIDNLLLDFNIKIIVPDGIICAYSNKDPKVLLWKHKFDYPIVSAWKTDSNEELHSIDLFDSAQWTWNFNSDTFTEKNNMVSPSIYLGMYQKQLYIQESPKVHKILINNSHIFDYHLIESRNTNLPTIPWKPVQASNNLLIEGLNEFSSFTNYTDKPNEEHDDKIGTTALSVLYASEYVNGNGFYLFLSEDLKESKKAFCKSTPNKNLERNASEKNKFSFEFNETETSLNIIIISMGHWWREILVISLTTGLLLNIIFSPRIPRKHEIVVIEHHIAVSTASEITEKSLSPNHKTHKPNFEVKDNSFEIFTSRFQSDFNYVRCLGKGGFGVVFEAKNKLDDCNYAVKRIQLPNKKEKKDRVMREVKTLANCEHHNIVRYFQAWVEMPPAGWQEYQDAKWFNHSTYSASMEIETPDSTSLPSFQKSSLTNDASFCTNIEISNSPSSKAIIYRKYTNGKIITRTSLAKTKNNKIDPCIQLKSSNKNESYDKNRNSCIRFNKFGVSQLEINSDSFQIEFGLSENYWRKNSDSKIIKKTKQKSKPINNSCFSNTNHSLKRLQHKYSTSKDKMSNVKEILPIRSYQPIVLLDQSSINVQKNLESKVYLYIQMQLCRKESLRDWLRDHKIEMRQPHPQSIFHQIVDAVDYVHHKGLIHRDLKPSNIFFSLDGQIRIGDFGLVTDMPEIESVTEFECSNSNDSKNNMQKSKIKRQTQQVGTHLYMSPEQLHGHPYDFRVDIYSLGLIFFELLVYFDTEMERVVTLKDLRIGNFPNGFQNKFPEEHSLLDLMLSNVACNRPATYDIKQKLLSMVSWANSNTMQLEKAQHSTDLEIASS